MSPKNSETTSNTLTSGLTIFVCPKLFTDPHIAIIQRNAITSWTLLRPRPEIILFGNEEGTAEICQELGLRYVPEVARNEFGTPLVNDIFEKAQKLATYDLMCYLNADIILMSDFILGVHRVIKSMNRFLIFGQRWDVDMNEPWNFDHPDWEQQLREYATQSKPPGPLCGLADYFVFPRGIWQDVPPFAVGRTAWDNWLIYRTRASRLPIVDATESVMVVHQKHDYKHQLHQPESWSEVQQGIEAKRNQALSGGEEYTQFGLYDATHILTLNALKRALGMRYILRHIDTAPVLYSSLASLIWVIRFRKFLLRALAMTLRLVRHWLTLKS